jgi:hypothetical protein
LTIEDADEGLEHSVATEQDLTELVGGIDPLLRDRNLITRPRDSTRTAYDLEDMELRFSAEGTDPTWSNWMEARILGQVSQVTGLGLVALDAECRETICRIKLFHPPGADALSSLDKLKPIGKQIGFGHGVEVATIGEDGVPISLLYFLREDA